VQEDRLDKTLELTTSLLNTRDVDVLLDKIVNIITENFGFEACDAFILDEERDTFVLKASKGFPVEVAERAEGVTISKELFKEDLAVSERYGRLTYVFKAVPSTPGSEYDRYYSVLHPDRANLPREGPDDWHELDVLYVVFEDSNGQIVGFLQPDGPISRKLPTPQMIMNIEVFASLASIAIANARLLTALNKTVRLYRAIIETTVAMQEPVDLKSTLETIVTKLNDLVPFDSVSVYIVDWNKGLLKPVFATGPDVDEVMSDLGPISGLAGEVARSGRVEIVEDSQADNRVEDVPGTEDTEVHETIMAIPLKGKGGVEGVLELYRDADRKYTQVEYSVAEPFAAHAAIALENATLREELKANFESVQKAYEDMKDLDKMKDSLVDTISHELRTPLTTILGYLEMISAGLYGEVTPKMKEKINSMLEQVHRINLLVAAMLEMSRLDKNALILDFTSVNIAMVTKEVLEDLGREITAKKHSVTVLFGNELPIVPADRLRVHDVLENLVSNAVKYTDPGGKITIGADILAGKVHMWVKDNGLGISEDEQANVFDRFFLADSGLIRADGRVGIGLNISREIVRRHGGEMWFDSKKGVGSTFHFTLPLKRAA